MGRMPKPTKLLEMSGAFEKHPERRRARRAEPVCQAPLGEPPERFADGTREQECWYELQRMIPEGVLTAADRWAAELACKLMAQVRKGYTLKPGELSQLTSLLARFGATPADRAKVTVNEKEPEENPFRKIAS